MSAFETDDAPYHGDKKDKKAFNDGYDDLTHSVSLGTERVVYYLPCKLSFKTNTALWESDHGDGIAY